MTSLKVCDWSGHVFGASGSPWSLKTKMAMPPSSTVHGGQHDTKYFTSILKSAFVADEVWGDTIEQARKYISCPQRKESIALPPRCSRCCRLRIFRSMIFGIALHVQHYTGEDARSLRFMDSVAGQQDWKRC